MTEDKYSLNAPLKLTTFTLLNNLHNVNTINFMTKNPTLSAKQLPYHHGNLRDALLNAAIKAMTEKGVTQFSLSELARGVGVTPAAAYKHFADKDALLLELAQHGFALLATRFDQAAPKSIPAKNAKQAIQRFERIGQAYVQFGYEEPAFFQLIFGKNANAYRSSMASNNARTPTFAYFAEALEDLYKFGVIAKMPSALDQWFAWSAIHGATELLIARVSSLVKVEQAAGAITTPVIKALK
jgi:AcrR family transcriptional regulator